MAEPTDSNKTKDPAQPAADAEGAGDTPELSLEQLDSMILSDDPEFANELKDVKLLPSDGSVDLDVVDLGETFLPEVENPWDQPVGARKVIVTILPFVPKLWELQFRFFHKVYHFRMRLRSSLREAGPKFLQALKNSVSNSKDFAQGRVSAFKSLSRGNKVIASLLIVACVLTAAFIYRSLTHGVLPAERELLTASLEEWAAHTYKYDAETEMDSFYDSPRTIQNIMSLPKMVVNLQPSPSSGPNPMAAVEFFLEGLSPEVIVEVKDRETEIRDLFQRTIEEMSYGELDSGEGKQQLTEKLRSDLNQHLTTGKIRRVFIKEFVLKP